MTDSRPNNATIIGFSILDSGPIGAVHIPYHDGLTVLYGQNGAGKTFVLDGIRSAMSGQRVHDGRFFVHVRVDEDYYDEIQDEPLVERSRPVALGSQLGTHLGDVLESRLKRHFILDRGEVESAMDLALGNMEFSTLAKFLTQLITTNEFSDIEAGFAPTPTAVGSCRVVSLEAVGGGEVPEWRVHMSSCAGEGATDGLRTELAHLVSDLEDFRRLDDGKAAFELSRAEMDTNVKDSDQLRLLRNRLAVALSDPPEEMRDALRDLHEWSIQMILRGGNLELDEYQKMREDEEAFSARTDEVLASLPALRMSVEELMLASSLGHLGALGGAIALDRDRLDMLARFDPSDTPGWVPFPLIDTESTVQVLNLPRLTGDSSGDIVERTTNAIHQHDDIVAAINEQQQRLDDYGNDRSDALELTYHLNDAISAVSDPLVKSANLFLDASLPEAPLIRAGETSLLETLRGNWIEWEAFDTPTLTWIPLEQLSMAQRRWTGLALDYALAQQKGEDLFLVIDEPERALHRGAISRMAANLPSLGTEDRMPIVVATHAPEFITANDAAVHHITRSSDPSGNARAEPMPATSGRNVAEAAAILGVSPTDLLQLTRTFVLVEGEHDMIVLAALLSDTLERSQAMLLPMRGKDALVSLLDSEILLPFTTAQLLIVLDHITDPDGLTEAWRAARDTARNDPSTAVSQFGSALRDLQSGTNPTGEDNAATNLAFSLLRSGQAHRVDLFGFSRVGIEKYLPIEAFTDDPDLSWETLDDEYMALPRSQRTGEKDWLRRVHRIKITSESVRDAVESMDTMNISYEFAGLASAIQSSRRPVDQQSSNS